MEKNHLTDKAESEPSSAGNMTIAELTTRRLEGLLPSEEPEIPEEPEEEAQAEEESFEADEPEATEDSQKIDESDEEEGESADVLSQIDLDSLSDEQILNLVQSSNGKSKLLKRIGQLTARAKAAEERIAESERSKREQDLLGLSDEIQNNPLTDITTIEGLRDKAKEQKEVMKWAKKVLKMSEGRDPEDVVATVEGKDITREEAWECLENAEATINEYIPAQYKTVQENQGAEQLKKQVDAALPQELPWIQEQDNEMNARYQAMLNDPILKKVKLPPILEAQLPYLLAHAANSIYGKKVEPKKTEPKKTVNLAGAKLTPPSTPSSGVGQAARNNSGKAKSMTEKQSQFRKSGSINDYITLRTLQLSNTP